MPRVGLTTGPLVVLSMLALGGSGCSRATTPEGRGEELFAYCTQCHGDDGGGIHDFRAPAIAGLPEWYLEAQLMKFREGARGDHPADVDGLRMRPMSRTLATNEEVALVAQHVAAMPVVHNAPTLEGGDVERGRALFTPCVQCHGERAEGKREMNGPPLTGLDDWYIQAQIHKFKAGIRGADALDASGAQMRAMANNLPDDQAIADVAAFIASLR